MTHADNLGDAVSFYSQFLGEFLLSAASVSALPFIGVFASTGMIIWAAVGLAGLVSGMVTVRVARRKNRPAEPTLNNSRLDTAAQPAILTNAGSVSADDVTQAA
ncbi:MULTISPECIES: hypothetical protein [unclassified Arthrobacter]|uniref:hypothetical protein n=1 Tax=unclassified Arthrobacter TaxID=235627 RepID=UPI000CE3D4DC|nr:MULTISPECIES: hypothetical protein [unclassified Arthrobacter]